MNDEEFVRVARVLSSDHGLRVLKSLSGDKWKIASEVSAYLGIHTSTASKYLFRLYEGGLLERRIRRTGRRSTFEYRPKSSTIHLRLEISGNQDIVALEAWQAYLTFFYYLIVHGIRLGFLEFAEEAEKLVHKLRVETGIEDLCLYDPRCDIHVARRLVGRMIEEGRLEGKVSAAKQASEIVFGALRSLCEGRIGKLATERLFSSVLSELGRNQRRICEELGLTEDFRGEFRNE